MRECFQHLYLNQMENLWTFCFPSAAHCLSHIVSVEFLPNSRIKLKISFKNWFSMFGISNINLESCKAVLRRMLDYWVICECCFSFFWQIQTTNAFENLLTLMYDWKIKTYARTRSINLESLCVRVKTMADQMEKTTSKYILRCIVCKCMYFKCKQHKRKYKQTG